MMILHHLGICYTDKGLGQLLEKAVLGYESKRRTNGNMNQRTGKMRIVLQTLIQLVGGDIM